MKHLDALNGTAVEGRAEALLARYKAEKAKADKAAAAARQEKENAEAQETARIAFAKTVENQMLDQGFDFDVVAVGAKHTTLRMKWALASKVTAHQISDNTQMFETARELGFKRMELLDGYDLGGTGTFNKGGCGVNCSRCGFPLRDQHGFCPRCGAAYRPTGERNMGAAQVPLNATSGPAQSNARAKAFLAIGAVVLVLACKLFILLASPTGFEPVLSP